MTLFRKKKNAAICCDGASCTAQHAQISNTANISVKVLGSGCTKCNQLEAAAYEALTQLGLHATIDHVTDFSQIASYGVMTTPALVIDNKVVSCGKVLKPQDMIKLLQNLRRES